VENEMQSELRRSIMNIKAIAHEEDEGGYWAEVPAIPGCAIQGETIDELLANLREAIEGSFVGLRRGALPQLQGTRVGNRHLRVVSGSH
jgi:predicted RNase H-like HicB family nuclease